MTRENIPNCADFVFFDIDQVFPSYLIFGNRLVCLHVRFGDFVCLLNRKECDTHESTKFEVSVDRRNCGASAVNCGSPSGCPLGGVLRLWLGLWRLLYVLLLLGVLLAVLLYELLLPLH